jgi:hypothetical protein
MRMIPIECPKCGREGNVPPDRLNAKLTCRGCQAVFHLDNTGRMVMGAPGDPSKDKNRPHVQYNKPGQGGFNLAEAWSNFPMAAKIGVPVVLLGLLAWRFMPGSGGPGYQNGSEAVIRGLLENDRSKVVSLSTSATAESSGKWFDVMHPLVEKQGVPKDASVTPALFSGNPDKEPSLVMMVVLSGSSPSSSPLPLNLTMVRDGGSWRLDGEKTLSDTEKMIASLKK